MVSRGSWFEGPIVQHVYIYSDSMISTLSLLLMADRVCSQDWGYYGVTLLGGSPIQPTLPLLLASSCVRLLVWCVKVFPLASARDQREYEE